MNPIQHVIQQSKLNLQINVISSKYKMWFLQKKKKKRHWKKPFFSAFSEKHHPYAFFANWGLQYVLIWVQADTLWRSIGGDHSEKIKIHTPTQAQKECYAGPQWHLEPLN